MDEFRKIFTYAVAQVEKKPLKVEAEKFIKKYRRQFKSNKVPCKFYDVNDPDSPCLRDKNGCCFEHKKGRP